MKPHVQVYLDGMGYDYTEFVPCEVCEAKAVDIHHIDARGMGGSVSRDILSNLMALCRPCHEKYGDITDLKPYLNRIHAHHLNQRT